MVIWANPDISGITLRSEPIKLPLFVNDLLLYITNPLVCILSIINEFKQFGQYSNFKVNFSKSEIHNIPTPPALLQKFLLRKTFLFRICMDSLKYLGVHVTANLSQLFYLNYKSLLSRTIKDLQSYDHNTFS